MQAGTVDIMGYLSHDYIILIGKKIADVIKALNQPSLGFLKGREY